MVPSEERLPGKGRLSWPSFPAEKIEAQQRVCGGITDTAPLARGGSGLLLSVTVALKKVWPHHHSEAGPLYRPSPGFTRVVFYRQGILMPQKDLAKLFHLRLNEATLFKLQVRDEKTTFVHLSQERRK